MERFSILRFSMGCASQSSVDVVAHPGKSHSDPNPSPSRGGGGEEEKTKSSSLGERLQKIVKGFKSLPQVFQLYRDDDGDDDDDEVEMEIGLPTDVQHVAHIGWDGSSSSWNRAPELMPNFPSLSLRQFELAMAQQGAAAAVSM